MNLYPAIDIRNGKVVRLLKGDFDAETVYGDDPASVAQTFASAGAPWIHVVDLDAARTGQAHNRSVIASIARSVESPVQTGGGVRDRASAEALLATGVARIVVGTAAHTNPTLVDELASAHPGRIAVGVDARRGMVATDGWVHGSDQSVLDMVTRFTHAGVAAFVVTDIERDGTLGGPDVSGLSDVLTATDVDVIASGGVGSLDDLRALAAVEIDGKRLAGVITGKALYEGKFTVSEALEVCS